jgi:hypothetical protein
VRVRTGDHTRDRTEHKQALAALQKLSLRRAMQTLLIKEGMIAWLVHFLRDPETLSEFAVEYGMALLMNLCLRSAGRRACADLDVLAVLDALIQTPNPQVRSYLAMCTSSLVPLQFGPLQPASSLSCVTEEA